MRWQRGHMGSPLGVVLRCPHDRRGHVVVAELIVGCDRRVRYSEARQDERSDEAGTVFACKAMNDDGMLILGNDTERGADGTAIGARDRVLRIAELRTPIVLWLVHGCVLNWNMMEPRLRRTRRSG